MKYLALGNFPNQGGGPASATSIVRPARMRARGAAGDHGDAPKGRFTTQTRRRRWPKRGQAERARARSPPLPSPLFPLYRYAESLKAAPFEGESLGQDEGSAFLMSMEEGPREPHK